MSCSCCDKFGKTLHYVSPAHGGWGMIRIAALIPESYQLFVAPFACGRHGALGGILNGVKDRISYLYIDEADIVSGHYENLIPDAVDELFASIPKKPKVLAIFVSCLDDLLGTDHVALNEKLSEQHPDVRFVTCHMNPLKTDTPIPPGIGVQISIYSLLDKADTHDRAMNLIGNNAPISRDCELFGIMTKHNIAVRHITDYTTFEGFQEMAKSSLNAVLSPTAVIASEKMEHDLEIPTLQAIHTYDLDEIAAFYDAVAAHFDISIDYNAQKAKADEAIRQAKTVIGDMPIAIDYQAVRKPFTLAKMLLEYGFSVRFVMTDGVKGIDRKGYDYVTAQHPEVEIVNAVHHDMARVPIRNGGYLCIGFDCAHATGSRKVLDIMEDQTLFGFYGVEKLMALLVEAYQAEEKDLKEIIEEAKLII